MLRFLVRALFVVFVLLQSLACASSQNRIPLTLTPLNIGLNKLKRGEYRVVGDTEAKSCATFVGLFPLPIWYVTLDRDPEKKGAKPEFWLFGGSVTGRARQAALNKALSRSPLADSLIAPRESNEEVAAYPWYDHICITVRGKAIQILSDEALPKAPPKESPAPEEPPELTPTE